MVEAKNCYVSANFDTGVFMNFSITAPLKENQYTNSIQDEYNLSFDDFQNLEILIAGVVSKYLESKKGNL
jgi:hypothetical protein